MADRLISRLLVLACALGAIPALAQTTARPAAEAALPDPTRPPSTIEMPVGGPGDAAATAATPVVLSSVLIPAKGKPQAVIDGRTLTVGDMVGEARIVRITEAGVSLKGAQGGIEVLALTPGIEKKMLRGTPDKRRTGMKTP